MPVVRPRRLDDVAPAHHQPSACGLWTVNENVRGAKAPSWTFSTRIVMPQSRSVGRFEPTKKIFVTVPVRTSFFEGACVEGPARGAVADRMSAAVAGARRFFNSIS